MVSDLMQTHLAAVSNQAEQHHEDADDVLDRRRRLSLIMRVRHELRQHAGTEVEYGYYFALGLMAVAAVAMLGFFRWKKWI